MKGSIYQAPVDILVSELLKKQKELEEQKLLNERPQPFSREILSKYFTEEYNNYPQEQSEILKIQIEEEINKVSAMTTQEAMNYFEERDKEHNRRAIFEKCLQREIYEAKVDGEARIAFRKKREEDFIAGTFDYPEDQKQSVEIAINIEDSQFPIEKRRLKSSTYEYLLAKQNALNNVQKIKR